jgi:flagellar export protein FliJ
LLKVKSASPQRWASGGVIGVVSMKSRDTLIRLKSYQVEETRRRVQQIETMMAEFSRMTADLDREIGIEEKRSGISDPHHFAYPTYARAAILRRNNLKSTVAELAGQLKNATLTLRRAQAELLEIETLERSVKPLEALPAIP